MYRLVVVAGTPDDHRHLRSALEADDVWRVRWVSSVADLARQLERDPADLLVVALPPRGAAALLTSLADAVAGPVPPVPIVPVLPDGASEDDVRHLPEVAEFLIAPLRPGEARARLCRLLDRTRARRVAATCDALTERLGLGTVLGEAPAMVALKARLPAVARAEATVLISGETGTGKEVAARAIHYLSRRRHGPFIPADCGAIPVELFENELFGHRRGAFTDARTEVTGVVAEAEGGTLFLDEVDALPLAAQTKLLRFLQHRVYRPLGHAALRHADVRIIAATNTDLEAAVSSQRFREDLYFRLNIIPLAVPPLRDRRDDVPLLAQHFLDRYAPADTRHAWTFVPGLLDVLQRHPWPGNVRELENLIQQVVALAPPGAIGLESLPPRFLHHRPAAVPGSFREAKAQAVAAFERDYARRLLSVYDGNVSRAAEAARKDRRAFGRLVKKYGIKSPSSRPGRAQPGVG
jgi:two-component system response regulator GlrR